MANICAFGFLNCFCPKSSYTGEIILHHWGIEDFLSALTRNVISLLRNAVSFASAAFMIELLVAGKGSILMSQLEREKQCLKLLSSL